MKKLPQYIWIYLFFITPIANAQIYKWVDAEGTVHYTQEKPPAEIENEIIQALIKIDNTEALNRLEKQKENVDALRDARITAQTDAKKKKEEGELQKANCEKSKARLKSYLRPRVNVKDQDGNVIRATEERRQEEIARSKKAIQDHCGK